MKILNLPHRTADYLCPVNGLCDVYEWKTGVRIPEQLIFYSTAGFQLISQKNAVPPKMLFLGNLSIGKRQYDFWQELIGFQMIAGEGRSFQRTLADIRELIDRGIPVVLFGLDLYDLEYQKKFYRQQRIPGHVVLMVGYDKNSVYVHDNSLMGIQRIALTDLKSAWQNDYLGISKKNAYFGIVMERPEPDVRKVLQSGFAKNAGLFLAPPVSFMGRPGYRRFWQEFPTWKEQYSDAQLREIYLHFVRFTGSILPELPSVLDADQSGLSNPRCGGRDMLAAAMTEYQAAFGQPSWALCSELLAESGRQIEQISNGFTKDILAQNYQQTSRYELAFRELGEREEKIQKILAADGSNCQSNNSQ